MKQQIRESKIEKAVCEYAKSKKVLTYKFLSTINGVPDRIFISPNGNVFFTEFKSPIGQVSPIQNYIIKKMRTNKASVYIVDNIEKGKSIIDENIKKK